MKILVTGRHGQVARSLIESGMRTGTEVVAVGRPELDLGLAVSVEESIARQAPDVVINAAAYTQVDQAENEQAAAFAVNAEGAAHVAQACAAHDIPLIQLSTDFVFDGLSGRPYCETDPAAPLNVYGRSKREGERRVASICTKHLIVRTSWVYSPWGRNFVLTMLRLAEDRSVVSVVNDQHGNPTYAPHLADALLTLAQKAASDPDKVRWGTYHAAGQGEATWCAFACELFRCATDEGLPSASVVPIATADYPTPAKRPANSRLDCGALQSAFSIKLPDWHSGVSTCVARISRNTRDTHHPGIS